MHGILLTERHIPYPVTYTSNGSLLKRKRWKENSGYRHENRENRQK